MISFKTLRSLCLDMIIFLIPIALLLFAFPYIFSVVSPFIFGYILFLAANPLNKRLKKRLPDGICAFLSLFIISALIFFVFRGLFLHLLKEITALSKNSDSWYSEALPFISDKISLINKKSTAAELFPTLFDALKGQLVEIIASFSSKILGFAKNIPSVLISIFASVLTAFFLLKDSLLLKKFSRSFLGEKGLSRFAQIKNSALDITFSYLKAQFIIGIIIFTVLFIGFFCLGIKYSLMLAFFTAFVDAVPVFGMGIILLPMSVFYFLSGKTSLGWGILILYGIGVMTRQLCEPKIIGQKLGIHPLLTVFAIYSGLKLFGVTGLVLGPICVILIKNIITTKASIVRD